MLPHNYFQRIQYWNRRGAGLWRGGRDTNREGGGTQLPRQPERPIYSLKRDDQEVTCRAVSCADTSPKPGVVVVVPQDPKFSKSETRGGPSGPKTV